jgi:hypothetical protein
MIDDLVDVVYRVGDSVDCRGLQGSVQVHGHFYQFKFLTLPPSLLDISVRGADISVKDISVKDISVRRRTFP